MTINSVIFLSDDKEIGHLAENLSDKIKRKVHVCDINKIGALIDYESSLLIINNSCLLEVSRIIKKKSLTLDKDASTAQYAVIISSNKVMDVESAFADGACCCIEKPLTPIKIINAIKCAEEKLKLCEKNRNLIKDSAIGTPRIVGESQAIRHLRSVIDRTASISGRVMIIGGPGSGKELAARTIHRKSPRSHCRFISCDFTETTPWEAQSLLFGNYYENKLGLLSQAEGGTLHINEPARLHPDIQLTLLNTINEKRFKPEGGPYKSLDVRIISSSSTRPEEYARSGRMNSDLYHRLNVIPIRIPLLIERIEDLPMLCDYFIERFHKMHGLPFKKITKDMTSLMQTYHWPYNVRQLHNMLEWLLITSPTDSDQIDCSHISSDNYSGHPLSSLIDTGYNMIDMKMKDARKIFERKYLEAQIRRFGGNISKTASFIEMERSALHRKIKTLGISKEIEENV